MATGTAILLGVGLYLVAALPVAVVVGRLLGGPPAEVALTRAAGVPTEAVLTPPVRGTLAGGLVGAHVAVARPVALVARHAHAGAHLQLAGAEAHPAHA